MNVDTVKNTKSKVSTTKNDIKFSLIPPIKLMNVNILTTWLKKQQHN